MGRWINSLDLDAARKVPQDIRLAKAVHILAVAQYLKPPEDMIAGFYQRAGALIVVERRRILEEFKPESERVYGRVMDPKEPSVNEAILGISSAIRHMQMYPKDPWAAGILRYAEANLRTLWYAQ